MQLPDSFVNEMNDFFTRHNEVPRDGFYESFDKVPLKGVRFSRSKIKNPEQEKEFLGDMNEEIKPVSWCSGGYYVNNEPGGRDPLYHAGVYYPQEPSAMLPAQVMAAKPGEIVLDLCAAPGGKSTQIGIAMRGEGLLVCNEPVPKRARILSSNIERIGLPNAIVTCAWPEQLAEKWPEGFDAVMVDAPCSGEGMFRRLPESRTEWSEEQARGCAQRQREILNAAAKLVRPGGRIVYSTCTYHPEENEGNADRFLWEHPDFELEAFSTGGISAPNGRYTCYPHRLRTEGQFAALFRRKGNGYASLPSNGLLPKAGREEAAILEAAFPCLPEATHRLGSTLVSLGQCPDLRGIKVLRAGLHLGEVRGKVVVPDHAAALGFPPLEFSVLDLDPENARRYMAGETVAADREGWLLIRYRGLVLGWGKGSGGIIRNHYPKGLRGNHYLP